MRLYDIHAHMADGRFADDFPEILARIRKNSVEGVMVICDPGDLNPDHERAVDLVRRNPQFSLAVACHPQNALHYTDHTEQIVREIARLPFCRCIGETGLDDYDNASTAEQQVHALERQMDIALESGLPVQLHVRDAHGRMLEILQRRKREGRLPVCVVHCFTRNAELMRAYLRLGCYISFAGPVTYTNANRVLTAVREIPSDRLLIETDSPWVAPVPHRGERGEPAFLSDTFRKIAELRGESPETLSEIIRENTTRVFGV